LTPDPNSIKIIYQCIEPFPRGFPTGQPLRTRKEQDKDKDYFCPEEDCFECFETLEQMQEHNCKESNSDFKSCIDEVKL
jgi:hypothetical protein